MQIIYLVRILIDSKKVFFNISSAIHMLILLIVVLHIFLRLGLARIGLFKFAVALTLAYGFFAHLMRHV